MLQNLKAEAKVIKKIRIIIILLVIFIAGLLSGCTQQQETNNNEYVAPVTNHKLIYKVIGRYDGVSGIEETASVTYENEQGGTEQQGDVRLPWEQTLYDMHDGDFVYISAQYGGEYGGLTVEIYLDGVLVRTSTSNGAYCIATASGVI